MKRYFVLILATSVENTILYKSKPYKSKSDAELDARWWYNRVDSTGRQMYGNICICETYNE